jgi:tripartite-type tricarboxylate transporter receptor subunit TctC
MKKIIAIIFVLLLLFTFSCKRAVKYPERDITDIVVWGAGGGTDVCNRVIMAEMAKVLGVNINVTNVTGGVAGSQGMLAAFEKDADGYTLCGLSESNVTAAVQEGWDKKMEVWDFFIVGGSPDLVSVTPSSPYNSIKDLIEAAKAKSGEIKAGASGAGSIHHLNLLALEDGTGAKFNFIPYPGSAPAQNAAMTGEITVIITSISEQAQLIRGEKLKALAMLIPDGFEFEGKTIPSAFAEYADLSKHLPISQAIGFAIRADADEKVKEVLVDAFNKAMASDVLKAFGKEKFYVLSGKSGQAAKDQFNELESKFAWKLDELGSAKVSPATLGIPKP